MALYVFMHSSFVAWIFYCIKGAFHKLMRNSMIENIDNIGYIELMNGKSLLAHKKRTEKKTVENRKAVHIFSNEESALFFKNAYFLWEHRTEILKDSRMLLANVRVSSGASFAGPLKDAMLGTYIELWENYDWAQIKNRDGNNALLCRVRVGLSGANVSVVSDEYGNTSRVDIPSACHKIGVLASLCVRYSKYAEEYEAYTLEEVVVRLQISNFERLWPLFRDNLQLIFNHNEEIYKREDWFLSPTPLRVYLVNNPIAIGTMLKLWEQGCEWLCHKCDKCGEQAYIYSFADSPMSGTTSVSYVCCHCGAGKQHVTTDRFLTRVKAIIDAKQKYQNGKDFIDGIPFETLVANLHRMNDNRL